MRKKVIIGVVSLGLLAAAILLGSRLIREQQVFKPKAFESVVPPTPTLETSFTITAPPNVMPGDPVVAFVIARSETAASNLFVAKINFPKNLLAVRSIDVPPTNTGLIKTWVEKSYDNTAGTISLVGGVPNGVWTPGGEPTQNVVMATILFTATASMGVANISFDNTSAIYRNSDNVNILQVKRGATVNIGSVTPTVTTTITPPITITGDPRPSSTVTPTRTPTPTRGVTITPPVSPTVTTVPTPITSAYDINQDGNVNLVDLSVMFSKWCISPVGCANGHRADVYRDGVINNIDYSYMKNELVRKGVIKGT